MTKKVKIILISIVVVFLFAVIGTYLVLRPSESRIVQIVQDGTVLYTINLDETEDKEITIYSPDGNKNTIHIENGDICISYAECPDQTCVKSGKLYSESLPIVCLPNKLIVRFA